MSFLSFKHCMVLAGVFIATAALYGHYAVAKPQHGGALVLDMDGSGTVELVPLKRSGAMWDIDNDDFRETVGWVAGGDGLLAADWNGNGEYDDHSELFADFDALARYDDNRDGVINPDDIVWRSLSVWMDGNRNGYTERTEARSLVDLGIMSIGFSARWLEQSVEGNIVSREAKFARVDDAGDVRDFVIQNVLFAYDNVDTIYDGEYSYNQYADFLPNAQGYGVMPSLRIAMMQDGEGPGNLLGLVHGFANKELYELFPTDDSVMNEVADIMYRWARVDRADPGARGVNLRDGRMLEYLEQMLDNEFRQIGAQGQANPKPGAASDLHQAFDIARASLYARLAVQGAGGALFDGDWYYEDFRDRFVGVTGLNRPVLDMLMLRALEMGSTAQREKFWSYVLTMIDFSIKIKNLPPYDIVLLDKAIRASDAQLSLKEMQYRMLPTYMVVSGFGGVQLKFR